MKLKRNCNLCDREYEYDSQHKSKYCSSSCRSLNRNQKNIAGVEGEDYVKCKICSFKFKEINNDHVKKHNISCVEYDKIYGINSRTSTITRTNKNTLTIMMSPEFSKKLSNSHKIENYIIKYGEESGRIKYQNMIANKTYKNGLKSYIDRYGEKIGRIKYKDVQSKKVISLKNQILLYGKSEGSKKYYDWKRKQKIKNTLPYFIELYGESIGFDKWVEKNNKISLSNSKIKEEDRLPFKKYIISVNKYTRISLSLNNLLMAELRGHDKGYDLDHIVSKIDGFKNGAPPYVIAHISNLKIVKDSYNRKKQHKSDMELSDIINRFEMDLEYKKIVSEIERINYSL